MKFLSCHQVIRDYFYLAGNATLKKQLQAVTSGCCRYKKLNTRDLICSLDISLEPSSKQSKKHVFKTDEKMESGNFAHMHSSH